MKTAWEFWFLHDFFRCICMPHEIYKIIINATKCLDNKIVWTNLVCWWSVINRTYTGCTLTVVKVCNIKDLFRAVKKVRKMHFLFYFILFSYKKKFRIKKNYLNPWSGHTTNLKNFRKMHFRSFVTGILVLVLSL